MTAHQGARSDGGRGEVWHLRFGRRRISLGRSGTLAVSRTVDQGVLGLASVLLAWRLGVDGFVPVSTLLILNSLSVVGSDFGLGTEILRRDLGALTSRSVVRVRVGNGLLAVVLVGVGLLFDSPTSLLIAGGGLIWAASAEAFVRKSALIRLNRTSRAALGEMAGSVALAVAIAVALASPGVALEAIIVGLVGKHLVESLVDRGWDAVFSAPGAPTWEPWLWLTSLLNFAISNVDFVLVALLLSARAFAIYSLGFRVGALFVSQLSYVVNRVALVDFGNSHRERSLSLSYRARKRQMFVIGTAAAIVTACLGPVLVLFLGSQWHDLMGVVIVLACAIPWRMCAGLGLNVLVASGDAKRASLWELSRLAGAAGVLTIGGLFGLATFTFSATAVAIVTATGYDRLAMRSSNSHGRSLLLVGAPAGLGLAALAAWLSL